MLMSVCARSNRLPCVAVSATPSKVSTKPTICSGVERMWKTAKFSTKTTSGMEACTIAALIAVV